MTAGGVSSLFCLKSTSKRNWRYQNCLWTNWRKLRGNIGPLSLLSMATEGWWSGVPAGNHWDHWQTSFFQPVLIWFSTPASATILTSPIGLLPWQHCSPQGQSLRPTKAVQRVCCGGANEPADPVWVGCIGGAMGGRIRGEREEEGKKRTYPEGTAEGGGR